MDSGASVDTAPPGELMQGVHLSNTGEWVAGVGRFIDSLPSTECSLLARQTDVMSNSQTVFVLPASTPVMNNVRLAFDLKQTFPFSPQPVNVGKGAARTWKDAMVTDNTINDDELTAVYTNANNLYYQARNVPDYALDFPDVVGVVGLFDSFQLSTMTGTVIMDSSLARGYDYTMLYKFLMSHGEELQKLDRSYKSNLLQWAQGLDPELTWPSGLNGTMRATGAELSADRSTITFTQHIEMPIPFDLGTTFYNRWWGGGQDLQLNVTVGPFRKLDSRAAQRMYSGHMDTITHSLTWVNRTDVVSSNPVWPNGTLTSITDTNSLKDRTLKFQAPILRHGIRLSYPPAENSLPTYGIGSYLIVKLQSILLDTDDLSSIIGDDRLVVPGFHKNAAGDRFTDRPVCSMRNNGISVFYRLSKADSTHVATLSTASPTDYRQRELLVGCRMLRHHYASLYIPASNIAGIDLANVGGLAGDDSSQLQASFDWLDLNESSVNRRGQARIRFALPVTAVIPIFKADYTPIRMLNDVKQTDSAPTYQIFSFPARYACDVPEVATGTAVSLGSDLLNVDFGVDYVVVTNMANCQGISFTNGKWQRPCIQLEAGAATTNAAEGELNLYNLGFFPSIEPTTAVPKTDMVVYPTHREFANFRLNYQQPDLPADLIAEFDAAYDSESGDGLRFTRVIFDSNSMDLQNYGSRQIDFEMLGGSIRNPYFLQLALRPCNQTEGAQPYRPCAALKEVTLLQSGYQVLSINEQEQLQCLGSMWPEAPAILGQSMSNGGNLGGFLLGKGGNTAILSTWQEAFGNTTLESNVDHPDAKGFNGSLFYRLGMAKDTIYGLNSLRGCADLQRNTRWRLVTSVLHNEQYRTGYGTPFTVQAKQYGAINALPVSTLGTNWYNPPAKYSDYSINAPLQTYAYAPVEDDENSPAITGYFNWRPFQGTDLFDTGETPLVRLFFVWCYRATWVFKSGGKTSGGQRIPLVEKIA